MFSNNRLFLMAILGSVISMVGLIWDAQIHILEHGLLAVEPLLNLSEPLATNPGHIVFGAGFVLTIATCLFGFTNTWTEIHRQSDRRQVWTVVAIPLALSLLTGLVGVAAVYFLGQTG